MTRTPFDENVREEASAEYAFAPSGPPSFTTGPDTLGPASDPNPDPTPATPYAPAAAGFDGEPGAPAPAPPARDVRMRTVVFGLVLLVIAGTVLVDVLTDVAVHAGGVLLALMLGGGLLLVAGARRT